MSLSARVKKDRDVIDAVKDEYKDAAYWLPFTALEIQAVFTTEELGKLDQLVKDMKQATDDTQRSTKIISKINEYAPVVVKALKIAKFFV